MTKVKERGHGKIPKVEVGMITEEKEKGSLGRTPKAAQREQRKAKVKAKVPSMETAITAAHGDTGRQIASNPSSSRMSGMFRSTINSQIH